MEATTSLHLVQSYSAWHNSFEVGLLQAARIAATKLRSFSILPHGWRVWIVPRLRHCMPRLLGDFPVVARATKRNAICKHWRPTEMKTLPNGKDSIQRSAP